MPRVAPVMAGVIALAAAAWVSGPIYRWAHHHIQSRPIYAATPQILRGLPSDRDAAVEELDVRLKAHFPDGMPQASLIAALREQGFDVSSGNGGGGGGFVQKRGYCLENCLGHWDVGWDRDAKGRVTNVRGGYGQIGIPFSPLFGELFDSDPA